MSGKTTYGLLTTLLIVAASLPLPAGAQAVGYGQFGNSFSSNLRTLELLTTSTEVFPRALFDLGVTGVEALALGTNGILYAAVHDDGGPEMLWTVDPSAFTAAPIGSLGLPSVDGSDLAVDGGGGLWLVTGGVLYSVDTDTGLALPVSGAVTELATIAFLGDTLFGVEGNPIDGWTLVEIDPATAVLTPLTPIPGIEEAIIFTVALMELSGMDFDDDGGLWISAWYQGGILPVYLSELYYLADPFDGEVTYHARIEGGDSLLWLALAVAGSPTTVIEVPALGSFGLVILALSLLTAAITSVRRHDSARRRSSAR